MRWISVGECLERLDIDKLVFVLDVDSGMPTRTRIVDRPAMKAQSLTGAGSAPRSAYGRTSLISGKGFALSRAFALTTRFLEPSGDGRMKQGTSIHKVDVDATLCSPDHLGDVRQRNLGLLFRNQ